jgi:hypothetical protein
MPVAVLGDVDAADRERLRAFAEEALDALGAPEVGVALRVVERPADRQSAGWANRWGVNIAADQLTRGDADLLRRTVFEETAHFWFIREHGDWGGDYMHELWACWAVSRFCGADWDPGELDSSSSYDLGRLTGGVLAGSAAAREAFERLQPGLRRIIGDLVDHLDGEAEPSEFAQTLADYQRTPVRRLAEKLERRGHKPAEAAATAKAAAKKLAREHPAWARAVGQPERADVLDALAELEAASRWRDEHVTGFGGRRGGVRSDALLDPALVRLRAATDRAGDALAALTAVN